MFGKVLNLPFKVLGGVARVVQAQEAKKWTEHAERDADSAREAASMDISVPADFDPGSFHLAASDALGLMQTGCILDACAQPSIPGALHIPLLDIGIGIAEVPADRRVAVVAEHPEDAERIALFLRHRGLDDTWAVTGGLRAWQQAHRATEKD